MDVRFTFRRYRLPLQVAVRTAHGVWLEREGVWARLELENGTIGFGEAAPIPWFGTETVDEIDSACRSVSEWGGAERLRDLPAKLGCLRHAIAAAEQALDDLEGTSAQTESANNAKETCEPLGVAALLPAGRDAISKIAEKAEIGFRVFKWKVGVADIGEELPLLDDLCAELPEGARLRLDANGAWSSRHAERWLERCADRPVEFVEQPIAPDARGAEDVLRGLAGDYPTQIALDESLVRDGDIERWLGNGWTGIFVVKPSLLADVRASIALLAKANADVVFSSALETAVGARSALKTAFEWKGKRRALGFGVWPLFQNAQFDGPALAPFIRFEDVQRLNPETLWNALR